MDQGFGSRAAAMGADGSGARVIDDKPPSTMAAQLVENLSTTKAARSDENNELKRLQTVIQKVIDSPDLLRTTEDRVEHNHLLIYVYARVHIDGIKLDDPFLDTNNLRSVLQKAINFLRFTIKETPSVLNYVPQGGSLLLRGRAPLWLWLLPQLLQLLGHDRCQELTGSIEGFLQYIQLITATHGLLWRTASYLGQYLRFTLTSKAPTVPLRTSILTGQPCWIICKVSPWRARPSINFHGHCPSCPRFRSTSSSGPTGAIQIDEHGIL